MIPEQETRHTQNIAHLKAALDFSLYLKCNLKVAQNFYSVVSILYIEVYFICR